MSNFKVKLSNFRLFPKNLTAKTILSWKMTLFHDKHKKMSHFYNEKMAQNTVKIAVFCPYGGLEKLEITFFVYFYGN